MVLLWKRIFPGQPLGVSENRHFPADRVSSGNQVTAIWLNLECSVAGLDESTKKIMHQAVGWSDKSYFDKKI